MFKKDVQVKKGLQHPLSRLLRMCSPAVLLVLFGFTVQVIEEWLVHPESVA